MVGDPDEGVDGRGMITTGASSERVPVAFEPVIDALVAEVSSRDREAEVHLYGSVATGRARIGRSDVDVLTIGLDVDTAAGIGLRLSERFAETCRGVEIAPAQPADLAGDHDDAYGLRVFLRHYCVHLVGPNAHRPTRDFPADRRAARGFNGDIGRHLRHWRDALDSDGPSTQLAERIARKSLLAVAGLVSVHEATWTTDRAIAASCWSEIEPPHADELRRLLGWSQGAPEVTTDDISDLLDGAVVHIVDRFAADVGLWPD